MKLYLASYADRPGGVAEIDLLERKMDGKCRYDIKTYVIL